MAKKRKNKANHYAPTIPQHHLDGKMGATVSVLPPLPALDDVPAFTLTADNGNINIKMSISPPPFRAPDEADESAEWELPGRNKKPKKEKQPKKRNYPEFVVSPQKLRRHVGLSDLQGLVLWLEADAPAPQWLLVRHKAEIRRVVVLMVPGLTLNMFDGSLDLTLDDNGGSLDKTKNNGEESEDYYPISLERQKLAPCVQAMASMFTHVWPIRAAGDDRHNRIHSPTTSFLTSSLPNSVDIVTATPSRPKRMKVTDCLMSLNELVENEYPLHSSQLEELRKGLGQEETDEDRQLLAQRTSEGWVETDISKGNNADKNQGGSILEGKTIYSIDCEMCMTEDGLELTRISILDWDSTVVYDTLVKPTKPITDYLTIHSGITKEKLEEITTTLKDVQAHLLEMFNNDTILVGQSLNSDLVAMKLAHPHTIDTSCIYHHTRGPPSKASLKWLARRFLKREIQTTGNPAGHDSVEDAQACLDLLKLKLEKGERFGTSDGNRESIFKRLSRPPHGPKRTAIIDYGDPQKFHGMYATAAIACVDDAQVVTSVTRCVSGDPSGTVNGIPAMDFTWAHLRGLETARLFTGTSPMGPIDIDGPLPEIVRDPLKKELAVKVEETVDRIWQVYEALPRCSAFVVYSGTGDPRKWRCMNEMQRRFKEEYKVRKWDEIGVKWTDTEEQELRKAFQTARRGVGFMVVK